MPVEPILIQTTIPREQDCWVLCCSFSSTNCWAGLWHGEVHLSKEDLMAEAWGSWLQCVNSQEAETVFWSFEIMVNTGPLEWMSWKPVLECFRFDFYPCVHTIRVYTLYCLNYVKLRDFYDPGCGLFHKFCWTKRAACCLVAQCPVKRLNQLRVSLISFLPRLVSSFCAVAHLLLVLWRLFFILDVVVYIPRIVCGVISIHSSSSFLS